jgi:DNA-binding response OmpR family regulator
MERKILVVDDDVATCNGLKEVLRRENFEVMAVGTYAEGRAALDGFQPDLLIADVRLGEYNGLQLLAMNPRAIPTIVITGHADVVIELEARRLGADYLIKPVSPAALMILVHQKLESSEPPMPT